MSNLIDSDACTCWLMRATNLQRRSRWRRWPCSRGARFAGERSIPPGVRIHPARRAGRGGDGHGELLLSRPATARLKRPMTPIRGCGVPRAGTRRSHGLILAPAWRRSPGTRQLLDELRTAHGGPPVRSSRARQGELARMRWRAEVKDLLCARGTPGARSVTLPIAYSHRYPNRRRARRCPLEFGGLSDLQPARRRRSPRGLSRVSIRRHRRLAEEDAAIRVGGVALTGCDPSRSQVEVQRITTVESPGARRGERHRSSRSPGPRHRDVPRRSRRPLGVRRRDGEGRQPPDPLLRLATSLAAYACARRGRARRRKLGGNQKVQPYQSSLRWCPAWRRSSRNRSSRPRATSPRQPAGSATTEDMPIVTAAQKSPADALRFAGHARCPLRRRRVQAGIRLVPEVFLLVAAGTGAGHFGEPITPATSTILQRRRVARGRMGARESAGIGRGGRGYARIQGPRSGTVPPSGRVRPRGAGPEHRGHVTVGCTHWCMQRSAPPMGVAPRALPKAAAQGDSNVAPLQGAWSFGLRLSDRLSSNLSLPFAKLRPAPNNYFFKTVT